MKAERRHELQSNTLAGFLENLPYHLKVHGNKLLTGVIIILLIVAFVRWRNANKIRQEQTIASSLSIARQSIQALTMLNLQRPDNAAQIAQNRANLVTDANNAIDTVAGENANDTVKAEALLAKGDLYWQLANMPELPGAATQPSLKYPKTREELLADAERYYGNVISTYPNAKMAKVAALFGLAAVAENKRDFPAAADKYNAILKEDTLPMYKDLANSRLKALDEVKQPLFLGTLHAEATTQPAGPVGVFAPATQPTTQPSTQP